MAVSVILCVARPVANETSLKKTEDRTHHPADCDRGYGGCLDASSRALFSLFSNRWLHSSIALVMVCGVSEQGHEGLTVTVWPTELLSSKGIVVKECGPSGTVRIWGELWNAKSLSGSRIEVGKTVIVRHVEGLLLFVEQLYDE